MRKEIIKIKNLNVEVNNSNKKINILENVNFSLKQGSITGLVGESGSGKSITALSIMKLLDEDRFNVTGEILYEDKNLLNLEEKEICKIRGKEIAMIFQNPMTALNPIMTIKEQIEEALIIHNEKMDRKTLKNRILEVMNLVKIPKAEEVMNQYPFQLSGGLRQRVMIALSICLNPKIIIADEPTTALDVTIQMEILDLLKELSQKINATVLIITHDLGVIAELCDEVIVMYLGNVVESSEIVEFFDNNAHPYSKGLMNSNPDNMKDKRFLNIKGSVPLIENKPVGCNFNTRCSFALEKCMNKKPNIFEIKSNHNVRCWLYEEAD